MKKNIYINEKEIFCYKNNADTCFIVSKNNKLVKISNDDNNKIDLTNITNFYIIYNNTFLEKIYLEKYTFDKIKQNKYNTIIEIESIDTENNTINYNINDNNAYLYKSQIDNIYEDYKEFPKLLIDYILNEYFRYNE